MAKLRDNLKDHPIVSLIFIIAGISTIITFLYLLNSNITSSSADNEPKLFIDTLQILPDTIKINSIKTSEVTKGKLESQPKEKINQPSGKNLPKTEIMPCFVTINLKNRTYREGDNYIYLYESAFYDYEFTAKYDGYQFHGTTQTCTYSLYMDGNYGRSTLTLVDNGNKLVGFLVGKDHDVIVNAELDMH